jgi:hypothetical protein
LGCFFVDISVFVGVSIGETEESVCLGEGRGGKRKCLPQKDLSAMILLPLRKTSALQRYRV